MSFVQGVTTTNFCREMQYSMLRIIYFFGAGRLAMVNYVLGTLLLNTTCVETKFTANCLYMNQALHVLLLCILDKAHQLLVFSLHLRCCVILHVFTMWPSLPLMQTLPILPVSQRLTRLDQLLLPFLGHHQPATVGVQSKVSAFDTAPSICISTLLIIKRLFIQDCFGTFAGILQLLCYSI